MTLPAFQRRGWCPSLVTPMESGDGFLLRLKPRLGVLTAHAAHAVADASAEFGNGMMSLTNRGNLQLRGFTPDSALDFAAIAVNLGLAHPDPDAELRRKLLISPLIGLDPALDPATFDIARMLDDLLARRAEFSPLPGKFGIVVDGGGALPMDHVAWDVLVQPRGGMVIISLDGGERAAYVSQADFRDAMQRLLLAFIADGAHRRMRDADAAEIFRKAGLVATLPRQLQKARSPIGALPGGFGIGIPFGLFNAAQLRKLADLATKIGDGTLRLTPWRAFILPGVSKDVMASAASPPGRPRLRAALPGLSRFAQTDAFILADDDPRLRIEACPGAPSCEQASVNTIELAKLMADQARWDGTLHISGCAKGCAHRGAAPLTLVGENGRWNIIRDGKAGAAPLLSGCEIGTLIEMAQRP